MNLDEIWQGCDDNVDNYLFKLEFLGLEELSMVWQLEDMFTELYTGDSIGSIYEQEAHGTLSREEEAYALHGLDAIKLK